MIGRLHGIVLDCPDPQRLASFYQELLGMIRVQDDPGWVVIGDAPDRVGVAFAQVSDTEPTTWPDPARPQYRHFDVAVVDLDVGEAAVLALGAARVGDAGGGSFRVFTDPVGHPFCLVQI